MKTQFARKKLLHRLTVGQYLNRRQREAAGIYGEALLERWIGAADGQSIVVDQRPETKAFLLPQGGKRPDLVNSDENIALGFDAKYCRVRGLGLFRQTIADIDGYRRMIGQWGLAGLWFFVAPREEIGSAFLIDWQDLTEPCGLAGQPALGATLDRGIEIRLSSADRHHARRVAQARGYADVDLPPEIAELD